MSKPIYHHLLVVRDWEIIENTLFHTEEEIEPRLREFAKEYQESMNWDDAQLEEILSGKDLDELREALEDNEMTVYLDTLTAP